MSRQVSARILWFDHVTNYGFASTSDGKKLFVHRRNFINGQQKQSSSLVEGTKIECELHDPVDDFTKALNSGSLRDAGLSHRRPRPTLTNVRSRCPKALRIRVVKQSEKADVVSVEEME